MTDHGFLGVVCHLYIIGLAISNLCANSKYQSSTVLKRGKAKKNFQNEVVWFWVITGHSRSLEMAPFDRPHINS